MGGGPSSDRLPGGLFSVGSNTQPCCWTLCSSRPLLSTGLQMAPVSTGADCPRGSHVAIRDVVGRGFGLDAAGHPSEPPGSAAWLLLPCCCWVLTDAAGSDTHSQRSQQSVTAALCSSSSNVQATNAALCSIFALLLAFFPPLIYSGGVCSSTPHEPRAVVLSAGADSAPPPSHVT